MTNDELIASLVGNGLLTKQEGANFQTKALSRGGNVRATAVELVKKGKLTKYQALQSLAGAAESLVFDEYIVLDLIGGGGMGEVYKARHGSMKRLVALKVLPAAKIKNEAAGRRFQREVRAAAKLLHPNIVTAFDAGQCRGRHYLVMEYVDGEDLERVVRQRGPLPVDHALDCIQQAARGLDFAHRQSIVHRDIKPANLLLDKAGTVKIVDLGLALGDNSLGPTVQGLTKTGEVFGTVSFMAPEQASESHEADARSDVYSLGCTLYWLLTGETVYSGGTTAQLMAHLEAPVPSLLGQRPTAPPRLDAVFHRMVAKLPADRYQTMAEVVDELDALRTGRFNDAAAVPPTRDWVPPEGVAGASHKTRARLRQAAKYLSLKSRRGRVVCLACAAVLTILFLVLASRKPDDRETTGPPSRQPPAAIAPFDAEEAEAHQEAWSKYLRTPVEQTNSVGMRLVLIPPGEFQMGSSPEQHAHALKMARAHPRPPAEDLLHADLELPQHRVRLNRPFLLSATEITVGHFKKFVQSASYVTEAEKLPSGSSNSNEADEEVDANRNAANWREPGWQTTDHSPVTQVTWNDAVAFCNWLSEQDQRPPCYRADSGGWSFVPLASGYRLPTEAEWEFACRAGTASQFSFGNDPQGLEEHAWYLANSDRQPQTVAHKLPNAFGLFDMHGNVWEWCHDWHSDEYYASSPADDPLGPDGGESRVLRGNGSCLATPFACRSAFRNFAAPTKRGGRQGFRVTRQLSLP